MCCVLHTLFKSHFISNVEQQAPHVYFQIHTRYLRVAREPHFSSDFQFIKSHSVDSMHVTLKTQYMKYLVLFQGWPRFPCMRTDCTPFSMMSRFQHKILNLNTKYGLYNPQCDIIWIACNVTSCVIFNNKCISIDRISGYSNPMMLKDTNM